ncbi:hypothetical protein A3B18_02580 [Candidatus Giovannonibacteria bacterium RIFCSPLOWO2_01_FULL_46_13]|uniref:HIT domain-containing protein n=1 Tax=Candidatus Giovannonibacteria bacterium RIFCSPLOWO2_01_FULL_46_13 TaxID=1798352 RepID=A0A1F5X596_9BACT|nr:MAG: hypothetical protein A3B18_02580 [Candidatus Giovannonibacteria bacterium RIFCSPLOWO2_01_FULL_46_13]
MIINCPFCNVDDEARILAQGKKVFAILSNPRLLPGHTLVIPKRHVEKIGELTKAERAELFDTAVKFQKKIISRFASGCDMRQNYRPFLSQDGVKVDHVHIHLLPREPNDILKEVLKHEKKMWSSLVPSERKKFTEILKKK